MDILVNFIQIYGSIASSLKLGLRKIPLADLICNNSICNFTVTVICWILSSVVLILLIAILIPFSLYKLIIKFILERRHGENFAGMMESADSLWIVEDETAYNIINIIMIFEFDKTKGNFTEFIKTMVETKLFKSKRFRSVRKFFMGYGYFLDNQISVEDIVSTVKISSSGTCNEKELRDFVSKHANTILPKNNTVCAQFIVCEDRIVIDGDDHPEKRAILFRVHHTAADGVSLMSILTKFVADENLPIMKVNENLAKMNDPFAILKYTLWQFYNCKSYINTLLDTPDRNPLRLPKLSTQKYAAFKIETKRGVTMDKVKKIKTAFKCSFSVVMYTALAASLRDFFKKNHPNDVPANLTVTFTVIPMKELLHYEHEDAKNILSLGNIKLPLSNATLPDILKIIAKEQQQYLSSCDSWAYYWQLKVFCGLFPSRLVKFLIRMNAITSAGFSNLPGIEKITMGGHGLRYLLFWGQNFITTGMTIALSTYDNKFQMSFMSDKNVIPSEDDAQRILDDVFVNIDKMYDIVTANFKNGTS